jgi:hypothetical protein
MTKNTDKKALTQWTKSAISYENYQSFIDKKSNKFELSLIDLLYISNFKGGNATINEPDQTISAKLIAYSEQLEEIDKEFCGFSLSALTDEKLDLLISKVLLVCKLTQKGNDTKIDGFSVSYVSALLNAYFPTLIPILDRRVLINLSLVNNSDIDKYGQVKNILNFYDPLIRNFAESCKKNKLDAREIDKNLFTTKLKQPEN